MTTACAIVILAPWVMALLILVVAGIIHDPNREENQPTPNNKKGE